MRIVRFDVIDFPLPVCIGVSKMNKKSTALLSGAKPTHELPV